MECFVFTVVGMMCAMIWTCRTWNFRLGRRISRPHYHLGEGVNGSRTLFRRDSPVAATPGDHANLSALVPLSHCLGYSLDELKQSFLHQGGGAPLLRGGGRYAPRK